MSTLRGLAILVVFAAAMALVPKIGWTLGGHGWKAPFHMELEPVDLPVKPGPTTFRLICRFDFDCETVTITADSLFGVEGVVPSTVTVPQDSAKPCTTEVDIILPANDTCGLTFRYECGERKVRDIYSFVTTADSGGYYHGDVRMRPWIPHFSSEAERDSVLRERRLSKPGWLERDTGSGWVGPKTSKGKVTRDTDLYPYIMTLEKKPLQGEQPQEFWARDTAFFRKPGETTFQRKPLFRGSPEDILRQKMRQQDSTRANAENIRVTCILFFEDSVAYRQAMSVADSLIATDSAGYYRAVLTLQELYDLAKYNVKAWDWQKPK